MTSQATQERTTCACGCGTPIQPGSKWARGHFHRGEGTFAPLPGPNETIELSGQGAEFPPGWDDPPELGRLAADELGQAADELGPDPGPADLRGDQRARPAAPKITAALRKDIEAKISMPLEIAAQAWRARDPICGGQAVEQRPATAAALTKIVLNSPDLINFFTGPAGGFMVYLELGAALWPIVELVLAHHIFGHGHGQADKPGRQAAGPDLSRYAA